jgi:hypothetical protein
MPFSAALNAGGDDHFPRQQRPGLAFYREREKAIRRFLDTRHAHAVADGQVEHAAEPFEIVHPVAARDLVELLPRRGSLLRLEPRPESERWNACLHAV